MFICKQVWLFCASHVSSIAIRFRVVDGYKWGSAYLAWLYREICQASHVQTCDIASLLILLQLWAWERFPCIAPQRLEVFPHNIIGDDAFHSHHLHWVHGIYNNWLRTCKTFIENFTYICSQLTCYYFILGGKMLYLS